MRTAPGLLAVAVLFALAGCVPTGGGTPAPATPSATPAFASDAEALAAAEKAYAKYIEVSASISAAGGSTPELIDPLVTPDQVAGEHEIAAYYSSRGWRTVGTPSVSRFKLERVDSDGSGKVEISFYVCVDATETRVVDASGADVTPSNRPDRVPLEVSMRSAEKSRSALLVARSETWSGTGVC